MKELPPNSAPYLNTELLLWYKHAGIDLALVDEPVDQFSQHKKEALSRTGVTSQTSGVINKRPNPESADLSTLATHSIQMNPDQASGAAMPDKNAVIAAREKAQAAGTIKELQEVLAEFRGCNLHLSAKNLVFADGNPDADIMLIGDAPGRDEDIHGLPFVGHSGRLLDSMLAAIKLNRENTYLTNAIPWRPPGNRTPTHQEIEICRPFIERHIELVNPNLIILLGGAAAKILLNSNQGIVKLRGRWSSYELADRQIDTMPIFHPANLLSQPLQKQMVWQDLLKIRKKILES